MFKNLNVSTIHYGIESQDFVPGDKRSCKKALKIPEGKKVILFGAPGIDNPRKGFRQLEGALLKLQKEVPELFLISFGSGSISTTNLEIPWLNLGHLEKNQILSLVYNCADVFIIPSLQEAFGQTALEAMSTGTPVIGFRTGGIPDIVEDEVTGYLVETGNIEDLAKAIYRLFKLNESEYENMSKSCRSKVLKGFTLNHQSEKYIRIYNELI
jgi:glycosyltransferase involved in cell wall biosynthesis